MAKLYFRYGTMNSGKSFQLQIVAHNYEEQGKKVIVLKPAQDNKDEYISSRTGFKRRPDIIIEKETDIYNAVSDYMAENNHYAKCILIDEAQFLSKDQVYQLSEIVDCWNVPVIAYGLKNDFRNELFEGSYHLLTHAESIEEIKTICAKCERKAHMVLRYEDGEAVFDGEQIVVDNEENRANKTQYTPVCRRCYKITKHWDKYGKWGVILED